MRIRLSKGDIERLEAAGATIGPAARIPGEESDEELLERIAKGRTAGEKISGTSIPPVGWKAFGIPQPEAEFRFCQERLWKIDYAWPEIKLAFEIEGGIWKQGRHNRPASMIAEMDKYNRLACLGWRLLRCTPEQVKDGSIFATIREAMGISNIQRSQS